MMKSRSACFVEFSSVHGQLPPRFNRYDYFVCSDTTVVPLVHRHYTASSLPVFSRDFPWARVEQNLQNRNKNSKQQTGIVESEDEEVESRRLCLGMPLSFPMSQWGSSLITPKLLELLVKAASVEEQGHHLPLSLIVEAVQSE